jgi:hypothetical protein
MAWGPCRGHGRGGVSTSEADKILESQGMGAGAGPNSILGAFDVVVSQSNHAKIPVRRACGLAGLAGLAVYLLVFVTGLVCTPMVDPFLWSLLWFPVASLFYIFVQYG